MPFLKNIKISPPVLPGREGLSIQPGDLSRFAPYGNGVFGGSDVYGHQENLIDPIASAPLTEDSGGSVYFPNSASIEDFGALLRLMGIRGDRKDYAAFLFDSTDSVKDSFLRQMRLVSRFGMRFLFKSLDKGGYDSFPNQSLTLEDALLEFIDTEKARWGTHFGHPRIRGKAGGDGNYAQEELSFGFSVENSYHEVYRIWSRPWLVTK